MGEPGQEWDAMIVGFIASENPRAFLPLTAPIAATRLDAALAWWRRQALGLPPEHASRAKKTVFVGRLLQQYSADDHEGKLELRLLFVIDDIKPFAFVTPAPPFPLDKDTP